MINNEELLKEYERFICSGITLEKPNLYIFPKSKSERISFKVYDIIQNKQVSVIATKNVKYYLKKVLNNNEWWTFEGTYNQDKTTFYVDKATLNFKEKETKEILTQIKNLQDKDLTKRDTI